MCGGLSLMVATEGYSLLGLTALRSLKKVGLERVRLDQSET